MSKPIARAVPKIAGAPFSDELIQKWVTEIQQAMPMASRAAELKALALKAAAWERQQCAALCQPVAGAETGPVTRAALAVAQSAIQNRDSLNNEVGLTRRASGLGAL